MDIISAILLALLAILVLHFIWSRRSIHQTWERLGVKGPAASSIFMGNFQEINKKGSFHVYDEWTKKYGKVFGYYETCMPTLVVADPDMLREIMIKQFNNFSERRLFIDNTHDEFNNLVDMGGDKWKRVRGISSPTFSAKRMKQMSPLIHKCVDKLMNLFQKRVQDGKPFDIAEDTKRLTLDVIASTVFSYDTNIFEDENSIFLKQLIRIFKQLELKHNPWQEQVKILLSLIFPKFLKFLRLFNPRAVSVQNQWFLDLAKKMIEDRQKTGEFRGDYMQLMLNIHQRQDGSFSGGETDTDGSDNEGERQLRRVAKHKQLTMPEMQGQTFVFLAAGYETTSTTLAFLSYYLALYPDVQEKLQNEIDEYFPDYADSRNVNYESVQKLPYLDMCFCETSRLASIGQVVTNRICQRTTNVCGVTIPKDAKVVINIVEVHRSPELWGPEPVEDFVPERFEKDRKGNRHPMAYLPFGSGPRNCIGMRFAVMEAKMAIINMLKKFTIVRCEETLVPLPLSTDGIRGPIDGVYVKLVSRD